MKDTTELIEQVRSSIAAMRKYKRDNRLIGSIQVFVASDVLSNLKKTGQLVSDPRGNYKLDNYPVFKVNTCPEENGYPRGYYAVV